jgi:hypothetical protein
VSVPPRCGPEEEAVGADEPDDPQPERIAAPTAARMTGADRINLRLWFVLALTSMLLLLL